MLLEHGLLTRRGLMHQSLPGRHPLTGILKANAIPGSWFTSESTPAKHSIWQERPDETMVSLK
jgi:hypothetical protein